MSQAGLLFTDMMSSKRPLQQSTSQLSVKILFSLFPLIRWAQADKIYFCPYNKPVLQFSLVIISVCCSSPIAKQNIMLISIFIMLHFGQSSASLGAVSGFCNSSTVSGFKFLFVPGLSAHQR